MKEKLWIRSLACGHKRATNIAFINRIYTKPKVGDKAYCRECCKEFKIINVCKADEEIKKELKDLMKLTK